MAAVPNITNLSLCLVLATWRPRIWLIITLKTLPFLVCFMAILLLVFLVRVVLKNRRVICQRDSAAVVLGKPLLFPLTITHTRILPIRNQFTYKLLYVGIPIGFRGRIGSLISIDEDFKHFDDTSTIFRLFWEGIRLFNAWFSVDPVHYLHRGGDQYGLHKKLRQFLRDQVSLNHHLLTTLD